MRKLDYSQEAYDVIQKIEKENGSILFLISGGCCDGSAPLCFAEKEFTIGENDALLGYVEETPVYVSDILSEHYTAKDSFFLDVAPGRGGGFSLEAPFDVRFINRQHY